MRELAASWYALLSTLNATVAGSLSTLAQSLDVPLAGALLFGLIGTTAPCQLTTNASALAYIARRAGDRRAVACSALAYLLGKALVYTLLGVAVILAGQQLAQGSIPAIVVTRKALGPLMVVLGLHMPGLLPLRFTLGSGIAGWLETHAGSGTVGAFLLGVAFSFAFCPTLFLLFFGLTIPLALRSPAGVVYPALFALGATLPLLALAGVLALRVGTTKGYLAGARRLGAWLRPAAAVVFVLAGLNDTFTYWFL
ncbi:MAG: sulfite exporter TauE/SafE family protein [Chloroflexi bacterium]|nr:sulfite exporter TauE/SafE family protein [Chloroflexota bacterium]